jgi:hypothetical protein
VTEVKVEVRGLAELGRAFRQVDAELPKELKAAFRSIAERVIERARPFIPRVSGAAAASLKPRSTAKGAGIAFGGEKAPYYPWLDFGGKVGRKRSISRPVVPGGRYVYPAIAASRDAIGREVNEAVELVAERAGFDVRGGD